MITVNIQYFAILREQRGLAHETLATPAATAAALYEELRARYGFSLPCDRVRAAVDQTLEAPHGLVADERIDRNDREVWHA
jgi:molybdopterin converting factor small subunit